MKENLSSVLGLICLLTCVYPLNAQWVQTNGPYGGEIVSLVGCSNNMGSKTLLALTFSGELYVTTDACAHWRLTRVGSESVRVTMTLAVGSSDPAEPAKLFVSTTTGIFTSEDGGLHWDQSGLHGMSVGKIVSVPLANRKTIILASASHGVYRSLDFGKTWEKCNTGLNVSDGLYCVAALYSPDDLVNTCLVAGTNGGSGILRSTDDGRNWTVSKIALTDRFVKSLVAIRGNVFAGTRSGVFRSTDTGKSWNPIGEGALMGSVYSLYTMKPQVGVDTTWLMAGVDGRGILLSSDEGLTWKPYDTDPMRIYAPSIIGIPEGEEAAEYYAANMTGVYQLSRDRSHWAPVNNGLLNTSVYALAAGPVPTGDDSGRLFAGTWSGFFISTDKGNSWRPSNSGLGEQAVAAIAVENAKVYAGTMRGVFFSSNSGERWNSIGLNDKAVSSILLRGEDIFAGTWSGIFLTSDVGQNWTLSLEKYVWSLAATTDSKGNETIFAGTMEGIFKTTDNGTSWSATSVQSDVKTIAAHGMNVFAATRGGSYTHVRDSLSGGFKMKKSGDVFLSTDNGTSWRLLGLSDVSVESFAFCGTNVYAGVLGGGVMISTDNGLTWRSQGDGLTTNVTESLLIVGSDIYMGARNAGVWRRSLLREP